MLLQHRRYQQQRLSPSRPLWLSVLALNPPLIYVAVLHPSRRIHTPIVRLNNHVLTCWSRSSDPEAEQKVRNCMCCCDDNDNTGRPYSYATLDITICCMFMQIEVMEDRAVLCLVGESGSISTDSRNASSGSGSRLPIIVFFVATTQKHYNTAPHVFSYSIVMNKLRKRFLNNHDRNDL